MKKIVMPTSIEQIKELLAFVDGFVLGIENLSVNVPKCFSMEEVKEIIEQVKQEKKEIFVMCNKNMHKEDLDLLEQVMLDLEDLEINGIFFYDIALLTKKKKLHLKTPLIWNAEHLTTNYHTMNYWHECGVEGSVISSEITLEEIKEIEKNAKATLYFHAFGYQPIYTSYRHVIKNYFDTFSIKQGEKKSYQIEKEGYHYPIVETELGTTIYSAKPLEALKETLLLKNISYLIFNSYLIETEELKQIILLFSKITEENKDEIEQQLHQIIPETEKGFLYKETIYRVKKNEK